MFQATLAATDRDSPGPGSRALMAAGVAACVLAGFATGAQAQSLSTSSSQFNGGYSNSGYLNSPVNIGTRDANNNSVYVNGILETPNGSIFSNASGVSQSSTSGGVGASGLATAIGNSLNVVVEGSWNRSIPPRSTTATSPRPPA